MLVHISKFTFVNKTLPLICCLDFSKHKGQKKIWFLVKFIGEESEINIKQKKAEFYDWRWTDPLELPKLIVPFKRKLYEEIIEEFKTYF